MGLKYTQKDIDKGMILPDSEMGKKLGLTSDRFSEDSFLWLKDNILYISMLISKKEHQGYVLNILNKAKELGLSMICCPISARMKDILAKFGFKEKPFEVWFYEFKDK